MFVVGFIFNILNMILTPCAAVSSGEYGFESVYLALNFGEHFGMLNTTLIFSGGKNEQPTNTL